MSKRPVAKSTQPKKQHYGYAPTGVTEKKQQPVAVWVTVGILLVAAVVGIVIAATSSEDAASGEDNQPVTVSGTRLVPLPGGGEDPAVGETIPTITGKSFDGTPVKISPDTGKPQIIAVVTHWCSHCQAEVPQLVAKMADGTIPDEIAVTAVSTSVNRVNGNYPPSSWLTKEKFEAPVMADDVNQSAGTALGLTSFPYLVVTDASGKVVKRTTGELRPEQYQELVDAALGKAPGDGTVISGGESSPAPTVP